MSPSGPGTPSRPTVDRAVAANIQAFLRKTIQANWSYPENRAAGENDDRRIIEYRSRFYGPSDDSDCLDDKQQTGGTATTPKKLRPTTFFKRAPFFRSRRLSQGNPPKTEDSNEEALRLKRRAQHRGRECKSLQEMEWNNGLAIWTRRRDAWTGAVPVSEAFPNTDSEDESQESEAVDESEIEDDVPVREKPPAPVVKRKLSGLIVTSHPAPGCPLYPSIPAPPRRHIPRHEHLPFVVPVRELVPAEISVRPEIGPSVYKTLYMSLVQEGRQPLYPLPLSTVLSCCIQGWIDSGEWPGLAQTYREQMLHAKSPSSRPNFIRPSPAPSAPATPGFGPVTPLALESPASPALAPALAPAPAPTLVGPSAVGPRKLRRFSGSTSTGPSTPTTPAVKSSAQDDGPAPAATQTTSTWRRTKDNIKLATTSFSLRGHGGRHSRSTSLNIQTTAPSAVLTAEQPNNVAVQSTTISNTMPGAGPTPTAATAPSGPDSSAPTLTSSLSKNRAPGAGSKSVLFITPSSSSSKSSAPRQRHGPAHLPISILPLSPLLAQASPATPKAASIAAVEAAIEASSTAGSNRTTPVERYPGGGAKGPASADPDSDQETPTLADHPNGDGFAAATMFKGKARDLGGVDSLTGRVKSGLGLDG